MLQYARQTISVKLSIIFFGLSHSQHVCEKLTTVQVAGITPFSFATSCTEWSYFWIKHWVLLPCNIYLMFRILNITLLANQVL